MARDKGTLQLVAWVAVAAALIAALIFVVPEAISRDPMFRLSSMLALFVVAPQWGTVSKHVAGRSARADAGVHRRPVVDLLSHVFRESPYRLVNWCAAVSLPVCAVLRWLVPGDWATGWCLLSLLVVFLLQEAVTDADQPASTRGSARAAKPVAARLEWAPGAHSQEVANAAELRELLWRLHDEAAGQPTSADLVLPGAPRAVIGLGEPDSMVLTLPEGGPPQVAVAGPDGVAGAPVTYTADQEPAFPAGSDIPVDQAIDVLCAYLTAGELPRPGRV